jgi:hypothetical protein
VTEPPEGRWTHKHPVDPHYETTGKPAYWVCHTCRTEVLIDGRGVPITTPAAKAESAVEPPLSSQP